MSCLNICFLGTMEYGQALDLQEKVWALRKDNVIGDTILLVEHNSVLTLGRRGGRDNILLSAQELEKLGVKTFDITRGGDVTYHGPGQIVGYPIMDLNLYERDIKKFVGTIQNVFIELLKNEFDIEAYRDDKTYTGVWVEDKKITAIGIAVRQAVTMHGFAFNVNTDLSHFLWINPCGITDKGVTSVQALTGKEQDMEQMFKLVAKYFCKGFNLDCKIIDKQELLKFS